MATLKQKFNACLNSICEIDRVNHRISLPDDFSDKFWGEFENKFPEDVEKRLFSSMKFSVAKIKNIKGLSDRVSEKIKEDDGLYTGSDCKKLGLTYKQCLPCATTKGKWLNSSLIETVCKYYLEMRFSRSTFNTEKVLRILSKNGVEIKQKTRVYTIFSSTIEVKIETCKGTAILGILKKHKLDKNKLIPQLFGTIIERAYIGLDVEKFNLPTFERNIKINTGNGDKQRAKPTSVDIHKDHPELWRQLECGMWVLHAIYMDGQVNEKGEKNTHWESAWTQLYNDEAKLSRRGIVTHRNHAADDPKIVRKPKIKKVVEPDMFDEL